MEYKDYYDILGVSQDAPAQEIQRAYRKLARKYHPDVNKSAEAENRFKEINEAYQVLRDEEKRSKYDRFGSAWQQAQRSGGGEAPDFEEVFSRFGGGGGGAGRTVEFDLGGEGFSSFFEALFGGGGPGRGPGGAGGRRAAGGGWSRFGGGGGAPRPAAGADREAKLRLTLEEAARGGTRRITLGDPGGGQRRLKVKIPPGVRPGQRIRLGGQGADGTGGRGNLYLEVEIVPHPELRLDGRDLHTTLPLTPSEAVLGTEARVATLNGGVTVKVPPGTSSGRRIRLRGKGFPDADGAAGDLFAEVQIVVPKKPSKRERELYEQIDAESSFRPREASA